MTQARRRSAWSVGLLAIVFVSSLGCIEAGLAQSKPRTLRVGVGSKGGDFFSFGRALVETFDSQNADLSVEIISIEGAISSLESLQQGTSDCGFSYANVAYEAFAGRLRNEPGPLKHLRGVALVQVSPLYFLVRQQSSIKSIPDLRGRSVGIGVRGSASSHAGLLLLDRSEEHTSELQSQR